MVTGLERAILQKMLFERFIGAKHTSADNIPKGFPKHQRGQAKKALKNLVRQGYITPKATSYGLEVSLNPHRLTEIMQHIKN